VEITEAEQQRLERYKRARGMGPVAGFPARRSAVGDRWLNHRMALSEITRVSQTRRGLRSRRMTHGLSEVRRRYL